MGKGYVERMRNADLGGEIVKEPKKKGILPKFGIGKRKIEIPNQPEFDEKDFGENPGTEGPGIHFVKGNVEEAPISVQEEAEKKGRILNKTNIFRGLAILLGGGTVFIVTKKILTDREKSSQK